MRITGRKKEIIVTAGGKNVAPAVLEDRLRAHALVSQCMVVGDGQPFIAALVTIDPESFPDWAAARSPTRITEPDVARRKAKTSPGDNTEAMAARKPAALPSRIERVGTLLAPTATRARGASPASASSNSVREQT